MFIHTWLANSSTGQQAVLFDTQRREVGWINNPAIMIGFFFIQVL